jgi:hypothetical protein
MDITTALWLFALWFTFWIGFCLGAWWMQRQQDAAHEKE